MVALVAVQLTSMSAHADDGDGEEQETGLVVVTAEPTARENPSDAALSRREIDAVGARSAQDILRSLSGIQLSQHGSEGKAAQFFLRGFDAAHGTDLTVNVDGLTLNEPSHVHGHGYADVGLVIPEAIKSVRLRKGPFDLDQGNLSTAGDITYELGVPQALRGTAVGVEGGLPGRGRIWTYDAPVDGNERDVVAGEVVADRGPFENRQTRRAGILGQKTLGDWRLRGGVQAAEFGLPGALRYDDISAGHISPDTTYTPDTTGRTGQIWLGTVHERSDDDWSHRTSLDMRARQFDGNENFTGYLFDEEHGDASREFQQGAMLVLSHRTQRVLSDNWSGVIYAGSSVDVFRQFADAVDETGVAYDRDWGGRALQGALYVAPGLSGFVGDHLQLEGGVRLEGLFFDFREDELLGSEQGREALAVVAPRMRARVFVGNNLVIVGAAGRGYRGPEARVFAGDESAPADTDLRQHRGGEPAVTAIDAAELGIIVNPSQWLELSAGAFAYLASGEYVYDHVSRVDVDLGATRRLGAEAAAEVELSQQYRMRGHLTVVDAHFRDSGDAIPFAPPVEGGITGLARWSNGLFSGVEWRGVGTRPLPFGAKAAPWALWNAHLGWERDNLQIRLNVDNLLDTSWAEGVYHYASHFDRSQPISTLPSVHQVTGHPRMFRLQLSYRW